MRIERPLPRRGQRAAAHPVIRRPVPGAPLDAYILAQLPLAAAWAVLTLAHYVCLLYLLCAGIAALVGLIPPGDPAIPMNLTTWQFSRVVMTAPRDALGEALTVPGGAPPSPADVLMLEVTVLTLRTGVRSASSAIRRRYPAPNRRPTAVARTTLTGVIPRPTDDPEETPAHDSLAAARQRRAERITAVRAVVAQLDAEWLSYTTDLEAYYLTKPVLRDATAAPTAAYQEALFELRNHADALGAGASAVDIDAAEHAAETALLAWGEANDHAEAAGLWDRSPAERAALKRLHALTGQLADPATPESMWQNLIVKINYQIGLLATSTVAVSWDHLARVPALEQRIRALPPPTTPS